MRTTIDLPDTLFRRVKVRAALDGLTLKALVARYIEQGLQQGARPPADDTLHSGRSALPIIAQAATGIPIPALGSGELERIEREEDCAKHGRSVGR